jgi:hypothetical protein
VGIFHVSICIRISGGLIQQLGEVLVQFRLIYLLASLAEPVHHALFSTGARCYSLLVPYFCDALLHNAANRVCQFDTTQQMWSYTHPPIHIVWMSDYHNSISCSTNTYFSLFGKGSTTHANYKKNYSPLLLQKKCFIYFSLFTPRNT